MISEARLDLDTPVGQLLLAASDAGLTHVVIGSDAARLPEAVPELTPSARGHLDAGCRALEEYFRGARKQFDDLVFAPSGTSFQLRVWRALSQIPFGTTESYGKLAHRIQSPGAARAVGMANNRNPLGIVVPCHRVIGADGKLVGYGGGVEMKQWLLVHEGSVLA